MSRRVVYPGLAIHAVLFLLALAAGAQPPVKNQNNIRVTFVNIGAGLCTVIECPGLPAQTAPILYDCGSSGRGDTGLDRAGTVQFVRTILSRYGVAPRVVVSHPDGDHYNYITSIMGNANASSIWLGAQTADYNITFQNWLMAQQQAGVAINVFAQGASNNGQPVGGLACGAGLLPNSGTWLLTVNAGDDDNAKSMVLRLAYGQFQATLTGDATAESLTSLMYNYRANVANGSIATTLLGAPHHGSITEGSNSFVWPQVFQPRIVVYSAGERYYHPRCEALDVYDDAGTLRNAQNHPLQCGDEGAYWLLDQANAQYLTESNGSVWVDANGQGGVQVTCDAANVNCNLN
ncbi:MAG TPA: hypothetical protein VEL74_15435 [Thermoanaerobaculia bacterium]|nr:hypothetical protein [Thermoanaerobaculia bacterium]